jgi:hypothetical protein
LHAAVLWRRVVDGEPERHDLHRFERPVAAVLVPQHRSPMERRLRDVVRREERNVRSYEPFGDVEQSVIADEPNPEGIALDELRAELLARDVGVPALEPGDVLARLTD